MCEPLWLIRARLLSQHCRDVIIFRFECWQHGRFRACASKRDSEQKFFACPFCAGRCPGTPIAQGLTRRRAKLPFIECVAAIAAKAPSPPRFT
jgi:hypothetical protein